MNYKYTQLDNRPTPEARAHNEAIFASDPVWGLEVTNKWASRCDVNIDPQHGNSRSFRDRETANWLPIFNPSLAACEAALTCPLPGEGTTLLFDRVDLDAVCAAAVLSIRAADGSTIRLAAGPVLTRLTEVADADNFAVGKTPWQPYPLPTAEKPWTAGGSVDSRRELAAINRAIMDRSVPLETRVEWARSWLLTGEEPEVTCGGCDERGGCSTPEICISGGNDNGSRYRREVEHERQGMVTALALARDFAGSKEGEILDVIRVSLDDDNISIVEMPGFSFPGATEIGFGLAPITVCIAEHFQPGDYRKITIAAWGMLGPEQMGAIRDGLNALETIPNPIGAPADGWGGNLISGILGSPQGTEVSVEQILDAIKSVM